MPRGVYPRVTGSQIQKKEIDKTLINQLIASILAQLHLLKDLIND